jgi:hypothetical protein
MAMRQCGLFWVVFLIGIVWGTDVKAQSPASQAPAPPVDEKAEKARSAASVPLHEVPEKFREGVRVTLEKTTLFSRGTSETFACHPPVYYWLLEHPDRGVVAWRRLGAPCLLISEQGPGRFTWTDEHGSKLEWEAVYHSASERIWYADGKVRPGPMLPLVPVKAVIVLRYCEVAGARGGQMIQHQADMFLYTDSIGAALATKLLGPAAPRMAHQCVTQMQAFFSGLAWYAQRYPDRADGLFMQGN